MFFHLLQPKIESVEILIGWIIRISPEISKVMQQQQGSVILFFDQSFIVRDHQEHVTARLALIQQLDQIVCLPGLKTNMSVANQAFDITVIVEF